MSNINNNFKIINLSSLNYITENKFTDQTPISLIRINRRKKTHLTWTTQREREIMKILIYIFTTHNIPYWLLFE